MSILSIVTLFTATKDVNAWHDRAVFANLPTGDYEFMGNGYPGRLIITDVDNTGKITGTVYGDRVIGFWDDVSHKILFMRMGSVPLPNLVNPYTIQVYKGYMFLTSGQNSTSGGTYCVANFAGEFLTPGGGGGSPQMNEFGWTAKYKLPCD